MDWKLGASWGSQPEVNQTQVKSKSMNPMLLTTCKCNRSLFFSFFFSSYFFLKSGIKASTKPKSRPIYEGLAGHYNMICIYFSLVNTLTHHPT